MTEVLFETSRLYLRQMTQKDLGLLAHIFCDADVMKYLGTVWTADQVQETLNEWQNEWGKKPYYYLPEFASQVLWELRKNGDLGLGKVL